MADLILVFEGLLRPYSVVNHFPLFFVFPVFRRAYSLVDAGGNHRHLTLTRPVKERVQLAVFGLPEHVGTVFYVDSLLPVSFLFFVGHWGLGLLVREVVVVIDKVLLFAVETVLIGINQDYVVLVVFQLKRISMDLH